MSYLEDTIDWQAIHYVDEWLDSKSSQEYKDQDLAQDWARISKIGEELGEAIQAFIGATGQNPRKGFTHGMDEVLDELADTAITAIFAIQHFTKNPHDTKSIIRNKIAKIEQRAREAKI